MVLLGSCRLVPSSQTFEPTANGMYRGFSFIQDSSALRWASWAAFLASSMDESRCLREGMVVFLVGWCTWGVYLISKSYGILLRAKDPKVRHAWVCIMAAGLVLQGIAGSEHWPLDVLV